MSTSSNDPIIQCPNCATEIRLTESLVAPILVATRREYESRLVEERKQIEDRERRLRDTDAGMEQRRMDLEAEIQNRIRSEREHIAKEEAEKARLALNDQLQSNREEVVELQKVIEERDKKLQEARRLQAEIKRKERQLEDARRDMELTVTSRVTASLAEIRRSALMEAEGKLKLKITERDETIAGMRRQVEDLNRRAEQGSQQLQGEAQEIELEKVLRARFAGDRIRRVSKGVAGGDITQDVMGPNGQICGRILWESKRTKRWSDSWLTKLRKDQRSLNANAAILISEIVPKSLETFDLINGVWVVEFRAGIALATAVRHALIEVWFTRKAQEDEKTKTEMVYRYLTGPKFRQRVSAIVERFTEMQNDLNRERTVMIRLWSKREEQILGVIEGTSGMYGDLQGIAGRSLPEIDGLELKLMPQPRQLNA